MANQWEIVDFGRWPEAARRRKGDCVARVNKDWVLGRERRWDVSVHGLLEDDILPELMVELWSRDIYRKRMCGGGVIEEGSLCPALSCESAMLSLMGSALVWRCCEYSLEEICNQRPYVIMQHVHSSIRPAFSVQATISKTGTKRCYHVPHSMYFLLTL